MLIQHGDIKSNPGSSKKHRPLTCCHWSVTSLTAHKMLKKSPIEAYNTNDKYDSICIIPLVYCIYNTRNQDQVETYYCRTDLLKYSFFPYTIVEWTKLDIALRNTKSLY